MFELSALGSLVEKQQGGGTPPRNDPAFWNGDIPWASVKDFKDDQLELQATEETITSLGLRSSTSSLIPPGTPMVCTRMAVGRCAVSELPTAINQDVRALYPKKGVNPRYLLRLVASLQGKAESLSVGSTVKGIRSSDFLAIKAHIAPENEQGVIAHILDTLDTQIQKTEALIAKLEKVKEGLLHDLLTRGIDESGRLRPSPEQAPGLYKESPLGLIPREWNPKTIGHLSSSIVDGPFGSNLKTEHYVAEPGVRVVRLQNITPFEYDDTDRAFIKEGHAEALSKNIVQPNDVLIASLGDGTHPAGRACLYPSNLPEAINKADCFRLRADSRVVTNSYIMLFMNSDIFAQQARKWTQGVTLQRINTTSLKRIYISCPPLEEQKLISRKINNALFLLATQREELDKLILKKQGLMDDLLTGRVRVTSLLDQAQATTPA